MEGLNGMNKKIKKMIALVTVFVSLLMVVPTFAAQPVRITAGDQVSIVHYPNKQESDEYLAYVSSTNKVKVTVANPKIGTGILYKESRGCVVYFKAKKSGTTTVTIKAGKVSKKIEVTVRNYANPLASVKVGNITVSGSKYNKSNEVDLNYVKYAGKKINITFKAAKGWKVKQVDYAEKTFMKSAKSKNGAKFSIRGGNRYRVLALMENKNTGETELIYVIFK